MFYSNLLTKGKYIEMITDLSYLKSLAGEDESFIRDMIDIFIEQIEEYDTGMSDLLKKSDYANLSKLAHKAKSSVSVMGMKQEADLLQQIEILAKTEERTDEYENMIAAFLKNSRLAIHELSEAYP